MGSDAEDKNEVEPAVLTAADRCVCDRRSQCEQLGELHHALVAGVIDADFPVAELGAIAAGRAAGRQDDQEITFCDLTGTGVQDTAIASLAFRLARERGLGTTLHS